MVVDVIVGEIDGQRLHLLALRNFGLNALLGGRQLLLTAAQQEQSVAFLREELCIFQAWFVRRLRGREKQSLVKLLIFAARLASGLFAEKVYQKSLANSLAEVPVISK